MQVLKGKYKEELKKKAEQLKFLVQKLTQDLNKAIPLVKKLISLK